MLLGGYGMEPTRWPLASLTNGNADLRRIGIATPAGLAGRGQSLAGRPGYAGSFFTGLLAVVVALPIAASCAAVDSGPGALPECDPAAPPASYEEFRSCAYQEPDTGTWIVDGDVAITDALYDALKAIERRGPRVLYRNSQWTKREWAEHTQHSVKVALHHLQAVVPLALSAEQVLGQRRHRCPPTPAPVRLR